MALSRFGGDSKIAILNTIPLADGHIKTHYLLLYHPVNPKIYDSILIQIRDQFGHKIYWLEGSTVIELHFHCKM